MSPSLALPPGVAAFLSAVRVGHLATVNAEREPSVIPICYQVEEGRLFTPIDLKPKPADWRRLQRVRNLLVRPAVAVVVDRWDEDWGRLGWVHLRGRARLLESGPLHARGLALLRDKYAQYRAMALEQRPLIVMDILRERHWGDLTPPGEPAH